MIIFVRHGESETNKFIHDGEQDLESKINSLGDPELTKLGKRQAVNTADFLVRKLHGMGAPKVNVHISLFTRAQQTAAPFLELYGENIAGKHISRDLMEWTPPKKNLSQLHLEKGLKHDKDWDNFAARVKDFILQFDDATSTDDAKITIVFGHSIFISSMVSYLASQRNRFPSSVEELCFQLPNCSISTVELRPTRWVTHYVGSIAHLPFELVSGTESPFGHR